MGKMSEPTIVEQSKYHRPGGLADMTETGGSGLTMPRCGTAEPLTLLTPTIVHRTEDFAAQSSRRARRRKWMDASLGFTS